MPARDIFHNAVKMHFRRNNDYNDPPSLDIGGMRCISTRAEKLIAAEKDGEKIAVELKVFRWIGTELQYCPDSL